MRPLAVLLGLIAVLALGGLLGSVPAASGSGHAAPCPPATTPTGSTTTPTSSTSPTSTTTPTTTTPTGTTPVPPTIPQPTGNPLNNVTVQNCTDSSIRATSKLQLASPHGPGGDPSNFAYAYAHDCSTGCQAIAVAFQVALIPQGAQVQSPQNVALAVNYNCDQCGVFAYAYQYVVDVPKGAQLSSATRRQLAQIRQQAASDVKTTQTFSALDTQLNALAAQLRTTVDQGLQSQHITAGHKQSHNRLRELGHS